MTQVTHLTANVSSPTVDQVIKFNGAFWVNGNVSSTSAGSGVTLFFSDTPSGISTYETISTIPDAGAEVDEVITINNQTLPFEKYSTAVALGRVTIDAGIWDFNTYTYATPSTGITTLTFNVYKRAAGGAETLLFSATSADINLTTVGLITVSTVQPAYTILDTDLLVVKLDATTDAIINVDVHFVHSGTEHYSNISTPLITLHNDLAGLQGGLSNERYHLDGSQYSNITGNAFQFSSQMSNYLPVSLSFNGTNISGTFASDAISLSVPDAGDGVAIYGGTNSATSGTVTFSNSNGVTFGMDTGNIMTASVFTNYQSTGAYLTTARASNDAVGLNTALTANGVSMTANSSGLSLNFPAFLTTAMQSASSSVFAKTGFTTTSTNGVVIVGTHNTDGLKLGVPAYLTTAQAPGAYLTTAMVSDAGSNFLNTSAGKNLTNISATFNSNSYSLSVGNYITTARASNDAIGLNTALTANGVSVTANSSGLSLNFPAFLTTAQPVGAYLTTAMQSQSSSVFAKTGFTSASTAGSDIVATHDTNGLSMGIPKYLTTAQSVGAYLTTARASNDAIGLNTALTGNGVSWTVNSSGLSLNVPAFLTTAQAPGAYLTTARASNDGIGLNTAMTNVTWTVNSSGLSINAGGYAGTGFATTTTNGSVVVGTHATNGMTLAVPPYLTTAQPTGAYLTTAMASNRGSDFINVTGGVTGTNITGTLFSNGISLSVANPGGGGNTLTVSAANGTFQSNAITFANSNGISFSTGTQGVYGTVATNYQSQGAYLTTAMASNEPHIRQIEYGTASQTSGTLILSGSGGITVTNNGNTAIISFDGHHIDAVLPSGNNNGTGFSSMTSGTFNINAAGVLSMSQNGNNLTISAPSAAASPVGISAGSVSNTFGTFTFDNSPTVSFGLGTGASAGHITASAAGGGGGVALLADGSTFTNGTVSFGNANSFSFKTSNGSIVGSYGDPDNWILVGNTSGTTASTIGTGALYFSGGNGITLSGNSNSIAFSVPSTTSVAGTNGLSISTNGSTMSFIGGAAASASNGSFTFSNLAFSNANNVTFGTSAGGIITASVSPGGAGGVESYFANLPSFAGMVTGASAITQTSGSSIFIQPFMLPYDISASYMRFLASYNDSAVGTAGTTSANTTFSIERYTTFALGLYTNGIGGSSRSIQQISSTSVGLTGRTIYSAGAQGSQYTVTLQKTYPQQGFSTNVYTTSYAVSSGSIVVSSNSNTLFTGQRFLDIPWLSSIPSGNYWLGIGASTSSASNSSNISFAGTAAMPMSLAGVSNTNVSVGILGAATAASDQQLFRGLGVWTTNASGFSKDSIGVNSISQVVSNPQLPFQIIREA